jgi:hypothetical protein
VVIDQATLQSYNANRMPNPNQPTGKVRETARRMFVEEPFLPQQVIAEVLKVSRARVGQVCEGLEQERKAAQKREVARLRAKYPLK